MMFYPLFVDLTGKQVVVIGGGEIAERKVTALIEGGAHVRLISPRLTASLRALAGSGRVSVLERTYEPGDCKGAFLVISAASDSSVREAVWKETEEQGILLNTVDEPALCNVIMPAVVRQGDLTLAISTGGKSPALAARLREQLTGMYGPEYGRLLHLLGRLRPEIQKKVREISNRKALHYRIVDSDVLAILAANDDAAAERRINEIIEEWEREEVVP
jgi:siroheme synthase-like protein